VNVEIFALGDDPDATLEVAAALDEALVRPVYTCRLCGWTTDPGSVGDMLDQLGEHGTEDHPEEFEEDQK
jgi:hypothetical protein